MAKRLYSSEEAFQILQSMSDESSGELSPSDSDSDYEPIESSGSEMETAEDRIMTKRSRRYEEAQASTSSAAPQDRQASTSSAAPQDRQASTSSAAPQDRQASTSSAALQERQASTSSAALQDRQASTSGSASPCAVPSTSRATLLDRPDASNGASHPQQGSAHASLPDVLLYPTWLPTTTSVEPIIPPFTAQPGPQIQSENETPFYYFQLFFTDDLLNHIVEQSNLFASQYIASNPNSSYARPFVWKPVTVEEFKTFLGLTLNMGLTKKMNCMPTGLLDPSTTCQFTPH